MKYRFSLAKSHNLLQKTDREPAIAERTQEEKPLLHVKSLKRGGGVSQAKEKKALWGRTWPLGTWKSSESLGPQWASQSRQDRRRGGSQPHQLWHCPTAGFSGWSTGPAEHILRGMDR